MAVELEAFFGTISILFLRNDVFERRIILLAQNCFIRWINDMTYCMGFSPNMELTRQKVQLLRIKKCSIILDIALFNINFAIHGSYR